MKKILNNKLFLSSFVADLISNFGDTLYYLALMNYVLLLPDTKFALAMITASETLPILSGLFLPFVKPIKVFDEKYFEFNSQNKEIVLFWTKF